MDERGPEDGDTIGRIVIDPRDDNRVFVAVQGALHDTNPTRGLFMTEDGGATWTRVLVPASASTGAIDVAIDKGNPDVMLATTWDKIRDEKSRLYGPNSYVYRSTDGGPHVGQGPQPAAPAERDRTRRSRPPTTSSARSASTSATATRTART